MAFFAYVVRSTAKPYFYKGHCADLAKRIKEHNSDMTQSLRPYIPEGLVYYEEFSTLNEALSIAKGLLAKAYVPGKVYKIVPAQQAHQCVYIIVKNLVTGLLK